MWRFSILGYPVTVEPWFWLTGFLLGGGLNIHDARGLTFTALWIVAVFISILVHELGHAMAARNYGAYPEIRLHGLGGVTIMPGGYFNRGQSIFVSAAGPLAGLALGVLVWLTYRGFPPRNDMVFLFFLFMMEINFFWTFINLLPILPLDGGQILRDVMGPRHLSTAMWIGVACAVAVGVWALTSDRMFLGIMMLFLAYGNFQNQSMQGGIRRG